MTTQIQIPADPAPLHCQYPTQCQPQGAHLEIRPEQDAAEWRYDPEIGGGVPSHVWHNRIHWVTCSCYLTEDQILVLSDELLPLIERVVAGHETTWDGSNHTGHLDDDAQDAIGDIQIRLEQEEGEAQVWNAGEWLACDSPAWESLCADAKTATDAEGAIDAVVEYLEQIADSDGIILDCTERAVESIRDDYLDSTDDA